MNRDKFVVGLCHGGSVRGECLESLVRLVAFDLTTGINRLENVTYATGLYIHVNRNNVVQRFLDNHTAPWLIFIDSDIEFQPEDIYNLLDAAEGHFIVAGLYMTYMFGQLTPCWFQSADPPQYADPWRAEKQPLAAAGMGFTVIHRDVLTALRSDSPTSWFAHDPVSTIAGTYSSGEDFTFCRRAAAFGFPMWGVSTIRVGHYKTSKI